MDSADDLGERRNDEEKAVVPLTKKMELNNYIVLMRKSVRKSRTRLINKLVREVKKLNGHKGSEDSKKKAKDKAIRVLEQIQCLKTFKEDEVSIAALKDPRSAKQALTADYKTAKDRAFAKLVFHPVVQQDVLKYRKQNPNWDLQVPLLLEKTKKKAKSKKSNAKTDVDTQSTFETSKHSLDNAETPASASIQKPGKSTKPKPKEKKPIKPTTGSNAIPLKPRKRPGELLSDEESSQSEDELYKPPPKVHKPVNPQEIDKSVGTVKVKYLKDLEDLEDLESKQEEIKPLPKSHPDRKPKSSFFIGGIDEDPSEEDEPQFQEKHHMSKPPRNHHESKPIFRKGKLINKPNRPTGPKFKSKQQDRYFSKPTLPDQSKPRQTKPPNPREFKSSSVAASPAPVEKLHPSWEAKKKQQSIIPAFQGKKIKFDD